MKAWYQPQGGTGRDKRPHWAELANDVYTAECGHRWPASRVTRKHESVKLSAACMRCYLLLKWGPDDDTKGRNARYAQRKASNHG